MIKHLQPQGRRTLRTLLTLATAAALSLGGALCGCGRMTCDPARGGGEEAGGEAVLSLVLPPALSAGTKASDDALQDLLVVVFDAKGAASENTLDAYCRFGADALRTSPTATVHTGLKHIYAIGNGGQKAVDIASRIGTEAELLRCVSEFTDNSRGSLVMVGSGRQEGLGEIALYAGRDYRNRVEIDLRRLCARISMGTVAGEFISPDYLEGSVRVKRVFLLNVPKRAPLFNGDYNDVLGPVSPTPDDFVKAPDAHHYYAYPRPRKSGDSPDGFYNFSSEEQTSDGILLLSPQAQDLTRVVVPEGASYLIAPQGALPGGVLKIDRDFYSYPNSSPAWRGEGVVRDETTRLVVETGVVLRGKEDAGERTEYYSIPIPYIQPNYAYKIGRIRLQRPGSPNPYEGLGYIECGADITVSAWDGSPIDGSYNPATDGDDGKFRF